MTTRTAYSARAYAGDSDIEAICALLNRIDALDDLEDNYAPDDLRQEFADPELDPARDLQLWHDAAGSLVGFGQLWVHNSDEKEIADGGFYWRVAPEARNSGIEDDMFAWAERRIREVGQERNQPVELRTWNRDTYAYSKEIASAQGFEIVRYFFRMTRPLNEPIPEPQYPEGFTMRRTHGAAEAEAWVDMFNMSFIDHYNHHPLLVESHKHWLTNPKYNPQRDLVAVAPDGTLAAFCFCWIDQEGNERNGRSEGWIDILGTRRGYRKIGLGRAMLLAGMQQLKSEGVANALLGVDAENPSGALRLYESVGFTVTMTSISYRRSL